jgi:hypothetical protein
VKSLFALFLSATLVVVSGIANEALITRAMLIPVEKRIDQRLESLFDEPFLILGMTRGLYLEKFGAVFSAELQLVSTPGTGTFGFTSPTKEMIAATRAKKLQRLPQLKEAMKGQLVSAATMLEKLPPEENIVIGISIFRRSWEDSTGLPSQVVYRAPRKDLLAARTAAALDAVIQVREF